LQLRRPQVALKEADLAEKSLGESGTIYLARAEAYRQRSMFDKAEDEYQSALKIQAGDANIYIALAETQVRLHEYRASIDSLQKALTITQTITWRAHNWQARMPSSVIIPELCRQSQGLRAAAAATRTTALCLRPRARYKF